MIRQKITRLQQGHHVQLELQDHHVRLEHQDRHVQLQQLLQLQHQVIIIQLLLAQITMKMEVYFQITKIADHFINAQMDMHIYINVQQDCILV